MDEFPKLGEGARFDLANALLTDPQILADLFQCELRTSADPMPASQDPPLSPVESIKRPGDRRPPLVPDLFELAFVALGVRRCDLTLVQNQGPVTSVLLPTVVPCQFVEDRPGGVGAEFVAPGVVELIDGFDESEVAVADPFRQAVSGPDAVLDDRDDQPQVGLDDPVLQFLGLGPQSFELIQVGRAGSTRIDAAPESFGQVLQVVHLAEQVCLLLASEERSTPDTGQVGRHACRGLRPACALAMGRLGHRREDLVASTRVAEAGMGDVLDLGLEDAMRTDRVGVSINTRARPLRLRMLTLGVTSLGHLLGRRFAGRAMDGELPIVEQTCCHLTSRAKGCNVERSATRRCRLASIGGLHSEYPTTRRPRWEW